MLVSGAFCETRKDVPLHPFAGALNLILPCERTVARRLKKDTGDVRTHILEFPRTFVRAGIHDNNLSIFKEHYHKTDSPCVVVLSADKKLIKGAISKKCDGTSEADLGGLGPADYVDLDQRLQELHHRRKFYTLTEDTAFRKSTCWSILLQLQRDAAAVQVAKDKAAAILKHRQKSQYSQVLREIPELAGRIHNHAENEPSWQH